MSKKNICIVLMLCLVVMAAAGCKGDSQEKESQNVTENVKEAKPEGNGSDSALGLQDKAEEESKTDWGQGSSGAPEEEEHKSDSKDSSSSENRREEKNGQSDVDRLGSQDNQENQGGQSNPGNQDKAENLGGQEKSEDTGNQEERLPLPNTETGWGAIS